MAFHINHRRHIVDHLRHFGMASPTELVAALPKKRRSKGSVGSMEYALSGLMQEGRVKRLFQGVYAFTDARYGKADAIVRDDPLGQALLELLAPRIDIGTHADDVYASILPLNPNWTRSDVMKKLRKLRRYDVIFKVGMQWSSHPAAIAAQSPVRSRGAPTTEPIDIFS